MMSAIQNFHSEEEKLMNSVTEIENLEKLIDRSLSEIKLLQNELKALEGDLNNFLDHYYGSGALFFRENQTLNDSHIQPIEDLDQAKKDLYEKIAKVCSKDTFHFTQTHADDSKSNFLKIEDYLTDSTEKSQSPHKMLELLANEYCDLLQQIQNLKEQKNELLTSPAYELKQEILWTNIKKEETISKIREDITHHVNRQA